jgi:hypothetical protein
MARPAPERQASNLHTNPGSWSPTRDALRPAERPLVAPNRPPSRPSASSGRPTTIRPKAVRRLGHPLTLIARGRSSCGSAVRPGPWRVRFVAVVGDRGERALSVTLRAKRARRGQRQSRNGRFGQAPRIEAVADDASSTPFLGRPSSGEPVRRLELIPALGRAIETAPKLGRPAIKDRVAAGSLPLTSVTGSCGRDFEGIRSRSWPARPPTWGRRRARSSRARVAEAARRGLRVRPVDGAILARAPAREAA